MILIIIKFCELLLRISPRIINSLRSYIKHSKECFLLFPNTSKLEASEAFSCSSRGRKFCFFPPSQPVFFYCIFIVFLLYNSSVTNSLNKIKNRCFLLKSSKSCDCVDHFFFFL